MKHANELWDVVFPPSMYSFQHASSHLDFSTSGTSNHVSLAALQPLLVPEMRQEGTSILLDGGVMDDLEHVCGRI